MGITLEEILGHAQAFKSGAEEATSKVLEALGAQAAITQGISDAYKVQAQDEITVAAAKNAADYATQLSRVKAANAMGTNLKESNEVITGLAAAAQDASDRKMAALKEIEKKESVTFLDNPLQYIKNQLTVNGDIAKHNIADAQLTAAQDRIQAVNANTQATVQTQNAISEPLTAASMAASARIAGVAAQVAADNAKIATIGYGTRGIEFALNAKKEVLATMFQAQGAQNAARSLQLSEENAAQSRIEFSYRQAEYKERAADKDAQEKLGQSVVDTINLGRKALLGPKYTPLTDIDGKMAISALKSKGVLSTEMQKYYESGTRTQMDGRVVIGNTPAAAASTLVSLPVQLNPTQIPIKQMLGQANQDLAAGIDEVARSGKSTNPVFTNVNPKDKASVDKGFNDRAQQLLNGYGSVINPGDSGNPYQIASVNQLYANSPTVRELPVVRKVLEPLMRAGTQLNDPKQVMFLVGEAVSKGKITHKEALELSTIYHVGVGANLAMRNFEGFGLKPSYKYNARVEINPNQLASTAIVDLTKPDEISRALMKMQAGALYRNTERAERENAAARKFRDRADTAPFPADTIFKPNVKAANALDAAADSVAPAIENFFKNSLPRASDFEPRDTSKQRVSGKITQ
jgi:hypothetical protein